MFDSSQGGQISWLLPGALIVLVAGLVLTAPRVRTDRARAALVLWGGWLVGTGLVFSYMQGIFHAYYTVALAPAVGAVVGIGSVLLWRARREPPAAWTLGAAIAVTAWWCYHLLGRTPDFVPWLRWVVLIGGVGAAVAVVATQRLSARIGLVAAGAALVAVLSGPTAYAVQTASKAHTGSIPSAGPSTGFGFAGGGPGGGRGFGGGFPGGIPAGGGTPAGGGFPGGTPAGGGFPGGTSQNGTSPGGFPGGGFGRGGGGAGGLLDAVSVSDEMKALLEANASRYTWVAATVGSQNASGYQLATGDPVMAIGGFNGTDPSPTLAQFQQYVADGKIHYFIGSRSAGFANTGGSNDSSAIAQWVADNFTATTVGTVTVYDLSS